MLYEVITVFNFLVPIFGAFLSAIFLGENIMELKNLGALVLVCAGIWLVTREKTTVQGNPASEPEADKARFLSASEISLV